MLEPTHDVWDFQEADSTYSLVKTPLPSCRPPASEESGTGKEWSVSCVRFEERTALMLITWSPSCSHVQVVGTHTRLLSCLAGTKQKKEEMPHGRHSETGI